MATKITFTPGMIVKTVRPASYLHKITRRRTLPTGSVIIDSRTCDLCGEEWATEELAVRCWRGHLDNM